MPSTEMVNRVLGAMKQHHIKDEFLSYLLGPVTGAVFYVSSVIGSDNNQSGKSSDKPFATTDAALAKATANKGDIIFLMPGHNEGIGNAQLTWDVAGVSIIGLGRGTLRPRFDFDHANASIDITAANMFARNITLLPSVTDVLVGIDVNAAVTDTLLEDIEALPGEDGAGVDDFALMIDVKAGCTRTHVVRPKLRQHASGAGYLAGVRFTGASDDCKVIDPDMVMSGAGLVAPINGITTLSTNLDIIGGMLTTDAEPGIEVVTGTTGRIVKTLIFGDLATIDAATVADTMAHFDVRYVEVGNEAGTLVKTESADD